MSDREYFQGKVDEFHRDCLKINEDCSTEGEDKDDIFNNISQLLFTFFKIVAKDQRHACAEVANNNLGSYELYSRVFNAQIENNVILSTGQRIAYDREMERLTEKYKPITDAIDDSMRIKSEDLNTKVGDDW